MQQLTQKLKSGTLKIKEVPIPLAYAGRIIVRNHYSLISSGTEGSTLRAARKGYIGKAKERPEQARQVIESLKSQGPIQTYRTVMKKLDSYTALGYSCAGEVIDMAPDVEGFTVEDYIACGGMTASHAEVVSVPVNLCVRLERDMDLKQAAYNTLGAIALQGVRQADVRLGETCAVIGLGLIGQLTGLILKAAGIRVIGMDVDPYMLETARNRCADSVFICNDHSTLEEAILSITEGIGCDAVIIAAASPSLSPINLAGAICRKRGTIVVVGDVPTGFDREPYFYKKELQVKMSCSYGPGRYDPEYEEKGIDYPPGYVRWTENRNMKAFQELIYKKKIDAGYLTTHTFKLDDAPAAYDLMLERSEPFIGILIEYDTAKEINQRKIKISPLPHAPRPSPGIGIGFIGAGSYAQSYLLANIHKDSKIALKGIMTATGVSARSVAERFGFEFCSGNEDDILDNKEIHAVFIATRHDSHAELVLKALRKGKHVFVEKPLCRTEEEFKEILDAYNSLTRVRAPLLMVGYNRRFSPLTVEMKKKLIHGPKAAIYRVNAGSIPSDSWIQDPDVGGRRIIGEVCHFVDFLTYVIESLPISVFASAMTDPQHLRDTLTVSLSYENGSIGTICYFSNGDKSLAKERIEIYENGCTAIIEDFKTLSIHAGGKKKKKKLIVQDKGQKNEMDEFIGALLRGEAEPIPPNQIFSTSLVTFKIVESLRTGQNIRL